MHVAICFWGLLRGIDVTLPSFEKHILKPLHDYSHSYEIFLHTYRFDGLFTNARSNETNIKIDELLYLKLKPNYHYIESQDDFNRKINFELFESMGDPYNDSFQSLHNSIAALNSLHHVTLAVKSLMNSGKRHYDALLFLRPDVLFLNPLPVELLFPQPRIDKNMSLLESSFHQLLDELLVNCSRKRISYKSRHETISVGKARDFKGQEWIYVPDFHHRAVECNDRMAMGPPRSMTIFGERFSSVYEYSLHSVLHSETYARNFLSKRKILAFEIPFRFRRVRFGNRVNARDAKEILPPDRWQSVRQNKTLRPFQISHRDFLSYANQYRQLWREIGSKTADISLEHNVSGTFIIQCSILSVIRRVDKKKHLTAVEKNLHEVEAIVNRYPYLRRDLVPPSRKSVSLNALSPDSKFTFSYSIPTDCSITESTKVRH